MSTLTFFDVPTQSTAKNPPRPRRAAKKSPAVAGRRERNKEAIRQRIVTAALQLFESKGFDQSTTKEIARRAKVAEGTVFNYFATKDDIALHFFEQEVDHAISAVRTNKRLRTAPLEERLFSLVQHQIEFLAPYERFIGAAFVQALRPTSKMAFSMRALELRNRYVAFVQELIDDALPKQRSPLGWVAPHAFWLFYLGVLLYWLHDTSEGKQSTLAFLDRSLTLGAAILKKGAF